MLLEAPSQDFMTDLLWKLYVNDLVLIAGSMEGGVKKSKKLKDGIESKSLIPHYEGIANLPNEEPVMECRKWSCAAYKKGSGKWVYKMHSGLRGRMQKLVILGVLYLWVRSL